MQRFASVAAAIWMLMTGAGILSAQDMEGGGSATPADSGQAALISDTEELQTEIEALQDEVAELETELGQAAVHEQQALSDRLRRKHARLRDQFATFVDQVARLKEAGADVGALEEFGAEFAARVSRYLRDEIETGVDRTATLWEEVSAAAPEEVAELEARLKSESQALDAHLQGLLENTETMSELGIDAEEELAFLDQTLRSRAEHLAGEIEFLSKERETLGMQAQGAGADEEKILGARIAAAGSQLNLMATSLGKTVDLMKQRELDTAEYKQLLITSTGQITEDIFEAEVALGLFRGWTEGVKEWLVTHGPRWLFRIVLFLVILLIFKIAANVTRRVVRRAVSTSKLAFSKLLQDFFVTVAGRAVLLLGALIALSQLGFHLGPILAGLGIAGFIVGFALQDTLSNFAAGMMILIYRPFDVGDAVEAGGVMGTVKQMSLVSTTISTWDNQRVVVPNGKIWGDVIRNITAEAVRRVDMTFGISYADDIDRAEKVLGEIIEGHELVLDDPAPVIRLHTLGESSVDFVVRPWAKTSDYWTVYWDVTRAVKKRFDEEDISIPFPQRDVHVYQTQPQTVPS